MQTLTVLCAVSKVSDYLVVEATTDVIKAKELFLELTTLRKDCHYPDCEVVYVDKEYSVERHHIIAENSLDIFSRNFCNHTFDNRIYNITLEIKDGKDNINTLKIQYPTTIECMLAIYEGFKLTKSGIIKNPIDAFFPDERPEPYLNIYILANDYNEAINKAITTRKKLISKKILYWSKVSERSEDTNVE